MVIILGRSSIWHERCKSFVYILQYNMKQEPRCHNYYTFNNVQLLVNTNKYKQLVTNKTIVCVGTAVTCIYKLPRIYFTTVQKASDIL